MLEAEVYNIFFPSNQVDSWYMEEDGFESRDKGGGRRVFVDLGSMEFISTIYTGDTEK